jgi:1,4-dihydroxy-2-naphthoyl-CoA hydrolase
MKFNPRFDAAYFNRLAGGHLPEYLSITILEVGQDMLRSQLEIRQHHLAPNGFLHAASVVALADTSAGYACIAHLPDLAESFTTLELKANFVSTATHGMVHCEAKAAHLGRTTHLWEARVINPANGRLMATFNCTQLLLQRKPAAG